ncbi:hypothetical protein JKF63_01555 [Porcisia hertigi]|uniref:Uncharacterized protein n=1 Tax=Porcisia hertigi TaxID=2761500 RepID=A0A836HHV5_9TRYP|nr:hypothetical protein JKF63_01555 [Porcisia hertigi]
MDAASRARVMNATVLTCMLALYVLYDAGFRFWMAHSDILPLTAALTHDEKTLDQYGGLGLAYDAAIENVRTLSLQHYSINGVRCTSNYSARRKTATARNTHQNGGLHRSTTPSTTDCFASAALPMAAVVVESTWLTPGQDAVSDVYAQRLLEGYRYALLSGAPWLLLSGSAAEASVGLQFLRQLPNPADTIFPESMLQRWPMPLLATALQLRKSMAPYGTLGAWVHGAGTRPLKSFPVSSMAPRASWQPDFHEGSMPSRSSLELSLNQLLSAHTFAEADAGYVRPTSLILGAEWLRRLDAQRQRGNSTTSVTDATGTAAGDPATPEQPRVTVYASGEPFDVADDDDDWTLEVGEVGHTARDAASAPWEQPRVRELCVNSSTMVHVTVPGMVMITDVNVNNRPRHVARALQQLVEQTLVHRYSTRNSAAHMDTEKGGWWWWLGQAYGVTVITGGWEQQRVKLLYMKALREAVADSQRGVQKAVHLLHQSRCQFEGKLLPFSCQGVRGPQLPLSALPFSTAVPARTRIFVLPPPYEGAQRVQPQPEWLRYTGELPASFNIEASQLAQLLGRVSFFVYFNYRRWMDWFLSSLPVGSYQDHFVLLSVLMSDFAEHRISGTDVLHLR